MQFNVTIEQANLILQALAQMPYHMTAALIQELQKQAQHHIQQEQAAPEELQ